MRDYLGARIAALRAEYNATWTYCRKSTASAGLYVEPDQAAGTKREREESMRIEDVFSRRVGPPRRQTFGTRSGSDLIKPRPARMKVWQSLTLAALLLLLALGLSACKSEEPVVSGMITTVAGPGEPGSDGVGGPATGARLIGPVGLAFDTAGNMFIAEYRGNRILKVDPSGILTVVAGTGKRGFFGDGGPATQAQLSSVHGMGVGPEGNLYISDMLNHRIRMVDENGIISTIAGTGEAGFSGDEGPATLAQLKQPHSIAFDSEGNLYVWDEFNFRIRMVDRNGTISTVAGTGKRGFSPDGTPATELSLGSFGDHAVSALAFDPAGTLYFIDFENNRIRMIDPNGLVQTIVGNGENEYSGDGGPATEAGINFLLGMAYDANGNLYIATYSYGSRVGNRVRMVDRSGDITTIAGTEKTGFSGDGGAAAEAELDIPSGVVIGPDGNLYIAVYGSNRVRMVTLAQD